MTKVLYWRQAIVLPKNNRQMALRNTKMLEFCLQAGAFVEMAVDELFGLSGKARRRVVFFQIRTATLARAQPGLFRLGRCLEV